MGTPSTSIRTVRPFGSPESGAPAYEAALRVHRSVLEAQRTALLEWRDTGRLPDESLRIVERELDHEERLLPRRHGR